MIIKIHFDHRVSPLKHKTGGDKGFRADVKNHYVVVISHTNHLAII